VGEITSPDSSSGSAMDDLSRGVDEAVASLSVFSQIIGAVLGPLGDVRGMQGPVRGFDSSSLARGYFPAGPESVGPPGVRGFDADTASGGSTYNFGDVVITEPVSDLEAIIIEVERRAEINSLRQRGSTSSRGGLNTGR